MISTTAPNPQEKSCKWSLEDTKSTTTHSHPLVTGTLMWAELCSLELHDPHPSTTEPVTWRLGGLLASLHTAKIKYSNKGEWKGKKLPLGPVCQGRNLKQLAVSFLQSESRNWWILCWCSILCRFMQWSHPQVRWVFPYPWAEPW